MNDPCILRRKDIFLGMICTMFFLDTVGPVASMGASAITWSLIISLAFFFPSGLIMAEMGSSYPAEGGMYAWVKMAYGPRWGARMSWLYWVNNAIWIPSTCIFMVNVFCQIFLGDVGFLFQLIMAVACIWCVVLFGLRPLRSATRLSNLSAACKILIVAAMCFMALYYLRKGNAPANDLSLASFLPRLDESFLFLSALVYNYLGFEVMSSMGNRMKNPRKDVPKATIANTFFISGLYVVTIFAILIVVPLDRMTIVDAIMDCFLLAPLSPTLTKTVVFIIGLIFLLVLFAQAVTWISGAGRMAAVAAKDGELPKVFGKMHTANQVPMGALLITGTVGTIIAIAYGLVARSAMELFWTLFSFTNIIFLIPYIINFQAYLKLKREKGRVKGAYHMFGPSMVGTVFARVEQLVLILTIAVILFTPGKPLDITACLGLFLGTSLVLLLGEYFIRHSSQ